MSEKQTNKKLRKAAMEASQLAYSPYSGAKVGCALLTEEGHIYSGCNVENSSFGATVCAERTAILKAVSQGEKKFNQIYVYTETGWPPCGMCRQVMAEFASPDLLVIIGNAKGEEKTLPFKELFPLAFTPEHMDN